MVQQAARGVGCGGSELGFRGSGLGATRGCANWRRRRGSGEVRGVGIEGRKAGERGAGIGEVGTTVGWAAVGSGVAAQGRLGFEELPMRGGEGNGAGVGIWSAVAGVGDGRWGGRQRRGRGAGDRGGVGASGGCGVVGGSCGGSRRGVWGRIQAAVEGRGAGVLLGAGRCRRQWRLEDLRGAALQWRRERRGKPGERRGGSVGSSGRE